jgi:hypothetical protein
MRFTLLALLIISFMPGVVYAASGTRIMSGAKVINGPIYIVSNQTVESIEFPNLEYLNGPIYVVGNAHLKSVKFPKLSFVNGPIYITYNYGLEIVDDSALATVNGPVYIYGNGKTLVIRDREHPNALRR